MPQRRQARFLINVHRIIPNRQHMAKQRLVPGILQRRGYECRKCKKVIFVAEVDEKEYKEMKEKITELEIKLYAVRKAVME